MMPPKKKLIEGLAVLAIPLALHCQNARSSDARAGAQPARSSSDSASASSSSLAVTPTEASTGQAQNFQPLPGSSAVRETFVVVGVSIFGAERSDAVQVIGNMKAALVRCFERDVANRPDPTIRHVRLSMRVDASGKVHETYLPQWEPTNPIPDPSAGGSPRPNPMNVEDSVIRCLDARVRRARFAAAKGPSTIAVDVRTMPR
jgi:hypothetical protein